MYPFEIKQTNIQYHTVSSPSGDGRPLRPNPSRRLLPPRRRRALQPLHPHFHPYNLRPRPGRTLASTTLVSACLGPMGSNSLPVAPITAPSAAATNINPATAAANAAAQAPQGAAIADAGGQDAAAVAAAPTGLDLLP